MTDLRSSLAAHVDTRASAPETHSRQARDLWRKSGGIIIYPDSEPGLSLELRNAINAIGERRFGKRGKK